MKTNRKVVRVKGVWGKRKLGGRREACKEGRKEGRKVKMARGINGRKEGSKEEGKKGDKQGAGRK